MQYTFRQHIRKTISLLAICVSTAAVAQAQSTVLVNGIVAGLSLGRRAAQGEFADKTVKAATYKGRSFPIKRTPAEQLTGKAADQIAFLEAQLEKCHLALLADSVGTVCSTDQQATIQAIQSLIASARPNWGQKYYRQEVAFYVAEDIRRRGIDGQLAPVPAK